VPGNDQFHCCPSGYSCEKGLCGKIMAKIPAVVLTESAPASVVKCDQENACADKYVEQFRVRVVSLSAQG